MRHALKTLLTLALIAAPSASHAQGYPFSQRQKIVQNVALTEIAIEYGRPVARGRELFGKLVPWDKVWHPGADSATKIVFNHDVQLEGHDIKAGTYSLGSFHVRADRGRSLSAKTPMCRIWTMLARLAMRSASTSRPSSSHTWNP
jgi:hypothetical protein